MDRTDYYSNYGICLDQHSDLYVRIWWSIRVLGQDLNVSAENLSSYLYDPDYTSVMGKYQPRNNVLLIHHHLS